MTDSLAAVLVHDARLWFSWKAKNCKKIFQKYNPGDCDVGSFVDRIKSKDLGVFLNHLPVLPLVGTYQGINLNCMCYQERVISMLHLADNERLIRHADFNSLQWVWDVLFWFYGTLFPLTHEGDTISIGLPDWYECKYQHGITTHSELARVLFMGMALAQRWEFENEQ